MGKAIKRLLYLRNISLDLGRSTKHKIDDASPIHKEVITSKWDKKRVEKKNINVFAAYQAMLVVRPSQGQSVEKRSEKLTWCDF